MRDDTQVLSELSAPLAATLDDTNSTTIVAVGKASIYVLGVAHFAKCIKGIVAANLQTSSDLAQRRTWPRRLIARPGRVSQL